MSCRMQFFAVLQSIAVVGVGPGEDFDPGVRQPTSCA